MGTEIFLGEPPANIKQWIIDHAIPPGPAPHADTWYKYEGDTEWRTVSIIGAISGDFNESLPTTQIDNVTNVVALEIGTDVTSIEDSAFYGCSNLTSVTIPDSVTYIGGEVFSSCSSLTSMTIPDTVTGIMDRAFLDCSGMTNIVIGSSVAIIGPSAFFGCSSLTSVTIPDSVDIIDEAAFSGCSGLESVTIIANGGNAENVKQKMIAAGISENITWNMPS